MWKIKKRFLCPIFLISAIFLQGCSFAQTSDDDSDQVLSFGTKSTISEEAEDGYEIIDKSMYLDTDLISEGTENSNSYETYKVTRGDYITEYSLLKGSVYINDVYEVKPDYDKGTMIFEEFLVEQGDYIEKGDPIAKVHIDLDTTELNELNLKLERYKQRFEEQKEEQEQLLKDYTQKQQEKMTTIERLELELSYEETQNQWEKTQKNWEKTIADTEEAIQTYETAVNTTEIIAEHEGFIVWTQSLTEGTELANTDLICDIASGDKVYVSISNSDELLSYGTSVSMLFGADKKEYSGTVVSLDSKSATYDMYDTNAYILVDASIADIIQYWNPTVSYVAQKMENVLLVERDAVTLENDIPYVTVQNEDGTLCKTGFVAGGSNTQYYWVYSGLSEGMTLVKIPE